MSNLLEQLNKEQFAAVTHIDGPLMIIAGAGTGKTKVITERIAWLIEQNHAKSDEILALTFTDKAAGEMEERVDQLLPIGYVDLWISTFHAFCERILRQHGLDIGLTTNFKLFTSVDALLLLSKYEELFPLEYYKPRGNRTQIIKDLLNHFSRAKDEMISPESYLSFAQSLLDKAQASISEDKSEQIMEANRILELAKCYEIYQKTLLKEQALDFGDVILYTIELFKTRPNILKLYREQFKYVLVDEFQDTNSAQYELVKLIAKPRGNITVVGDDDQAIYKFRGASLSNILNFRKDFPDAKNVVLVHNYRSAACILDHAYKVIRHNDPDRLEVRENINKALISNKEETGFVHHIHCNNHDEEVQTVLKQMLALHEKGASWSDFAILVRSNASADPYVNALSNAGIPFRFLALSGLYTSPLILDSTSWLRVILQPHDSTCMYRVLSHPRLGIDEGDIARLSFQSRKMAMSLYDVMNTVSSVEYLSPKTIQRVHEILDILQSLRIKSRRMPTSELYVATIKETGLYGDILQLPEYEQVEYFGLLQQFLSRIRRFEEQSADKTISHFLSELDLEREAGEQGELATDAELGPDVVNIMTIHASKGLEFRYIFLVKLIEQQFPSTHKKESIPLPEGIVADIENTKEHHLAEERRLFYVALTRAKEGAFLLSADDYGGKRKRKPSRFLSELSTDPKPGMRARGDTQLTRSDATSQTLTNHLSIPQKISFSQLSDFDLCPLQYKYKHLLKIPTFGKPHLSFGSSIHKAFELFMAEVLKRRGIGDMTIPTKDDLMKFFEDSWIESWYPSQKDREEKKEEGRKMMETAYDSWTSKSPEPLMIEQDFTLKIGGIVIKGRIDRIDTFDDGVEIIDYKTGKPKTKLDWKDKRQLILYQLALEQSFHIPLKVNKLSYLYVETNEKASFTAKEKDKEKLEQQIFQTMDAIQRSTFEATPGFSCRHCDFRDICPFALS